MTGLLSVSGLKVAYGGIHAVRGIDLEIAEGEKVCLIGANGAGKTTTLKAISGLLPESAGNVQFDGKPITRLSAHVISRLGLNLVPEGRGVFPRMNVAENLLMGAYTRRDKAGIRTDMERVYGLLPRLAERRTQKAGLLSGGEQQMLALGRAMMARPRLLMLDEPSMGLAPIMVETVFGLIREIADAGVALLLVEQNAHWALQTCERGYVMEQGVLTLAGNTRDLADNPAVRAAYLGDEAY
jgi:branched-chain amino acid transport system ATP-binding protein